LGVQAKDATNIGLAIDIAVPFALSAAMLAIRVAAVRTGRINLALHEAPAGSTVGGHTVLKHIGQTELQ
jgi:hypothetical protein